MSSKTPVYGGISKVEGGYLLEGMGPCDLEKTLHSGQAFRWKKLGTGHEGVVQGRLLRLKQGGPNSAVLMEPCTVDDARAAFRYLSMDVDQEAVERKLRSEGGHMAEAVSLSTGLRTLRQEPWETLIAFIISANNGVANITRIVENLSIQYGTRRQGPDGEYFCFPRPEQLIIAGHEGIWACKAGFRTRGICEAAVGVHSGEIDLRLISCMDYTKAKQALIRLHGIGEKVADCILLFSMDKPEAFPVDVWIERIVRLLYFSGEAIAHKQIRQWATERYGKLAGYANQFLFNYGRKFAASDLRAMDKAIKQGD